ncbi:hypothetical protein BDA96_03G092900 [Sorghum bicolor]|uniref:Uncharacterized protein n=2 Tax=Sorghum bicolor TaxID=4558 RepID=A0A921UP96_SORBI|nr:hypothetical protein BDA96_03G092900 [Sorghum bicolor]KAG0536785.1 hypothetical protein BDA96_03G092900 [Sorghum bicolor]KAG0536786.1 hypothetical protein BDA96_03G092900 [Sorghum bicolor]KAG0536787.1 hypothetical protein BDA96_03G092900 [Sorghum bicolor]KXG31999.1 hypothetical protein SORBI_3003G088700 [Sorghum bicolor]
MARASGSRRRSRRMRRGGKMPGDGDAVMKPHGQGVVKHAGRGIRRRGGDGGLRQVINTGSADSEVEHPSSTDSASEGWIYVPPSSPSHLVLLDSHHSYYTAVIVLLPPLRHGRRCAAASLL